VFQVTTLRSFQPTNVVKSFTAFFVATTLLWAIGNYVAIRDVLVSWPVFAVNLALSAGLGWWYYRYRYHTTFSYDDQAFDLRVGRQQTARKWREYDTVSLVHRGHGEFAVRLYESMSERHVEIPATALKLDAQDFRFEVMDYVGGSAGQQQHE
jgi:hypothetical protein